MTAEAKVLCSSLLGGQLIAVALTQAGSSIPVALLIANIPTGILLLTQRLLRRTATQDAQ